VKDIMRSTTPQLLLQWEKVLVLNNRVIPKQKNHLQRIKKHRNRNLLQEKNKTRIRPGILCDSWSLFVLILFEIKCNRADKTSVFIWI